MVSYIYIFFPKIKMLVCSEKTKIRRLIHILLHITLVTFIARYFFTLLFCYYDSNNYIISVWKPKQLGGREASRARTKNCHSVILSWHWLIFQSTSIQASWIVSRPKLCEVMRGNWHVFAIPWNMGCAHVKHYVSKRTARKHILSLSLSPHPRVW